MEACAGTSLACRLYSIPKPADCCLMCVCVSTEASSAICTCRQGHLDYLEPHVCHPTPPALSVSKLAG
eukprot:1002672-Pelagomonas_calceolata.AAC.4